MLEATQIKAILKLAGISHLEIGIDENYQTVRFMYIFKGTPGIKELTFQEIKDAFEIKSADVSFKEKE